MLTPIRSVGRHSRHVTHHSPLWRTTCATTNSANPTSPLQLTRICTCGRLADAYLCRVRVSFQHTSRLYLCSWETNSPLLQLHVDVLSSAERDAIDGTAKLSSHTSPALASTGESQTRPSMASSAGGHPDLTLLSTDNVHDGTAAGEGRGMRHPLAPPNSRREELAAGTTTRGNETSNDEAKLDASATVATLAVGEESVSNANPSSPNPGRKRHHRRHHHGHHHRHNFDSGPNTVIFHRPVEAAWHELRMGVRERLGPGNDTPADMDADKAWQAMFDADSSTALSLTAEVVGDQGIQLLCDLTQGGLDAQEKVFRCVGW